MTFPLIIIIISFIIDGISSHFINSSFTYISIFSTIYTIISFVIIHQFFSNTKKFLILLSIFGLLFDIVYTNTLLLNTTIFPLIGLIIIFLCNKLTNNIINNGIISIISIFSYYIISDLILIIINYQKFNIQLLFNVLINSILMTIIFSCLLTIIINKK